MAGRLKELLGAGLDPASTYRTDWQKQMMSTVSQLTALGYVASDSDMEKVLHRGGYCEQVYGMSLAEQVTYLKSEIGRVLLEEDSYSSTDYQKRFEELIETLRRRGV